MKKYLLFLFVLPFALISYTQIPDNSLIGYWPFNGDAQDESGNNNHGMINGATFVPDRHGSENSALLFNGIDNYIDCGNLNFDIHDEITISAWIKTSSYKVAHIVFKYIHTEDKGFHFNVDSGHVHVGGRNNAGDTYFYTEPSVDTVNDCSWHHVVATIEGNTWSTWMDGIFQASMTSTSLSPELSCSQNLLIGKTIYDETRYFEGYIDDIRIYNKAFDSCEIQALFNENFCFITVYDTIKIFDTITVEDTLRIELFITELSEPDNSNDLKVFPNPTNDVLWIDCGDFEKMEDYTLKITDAASIERWSASVTQKEYSIDLNGYTKGIYFLEIFNSENEKVEVKKILLY